MSNQFLIKCWDIILLLSILLHKLIPVFFVWIKRSLIDFQIYLMKFNKTVFSKFLNNLRITLDSIRVTPWIWGVISSSWLQYISISLESILFYPTSVRWVSLIQITAKLYLLIFAAVWVVLPVSHIIRKFQVSIIIIALVV